VTRALAIETATSRCAVAIGTEDGALASATVDGGRRHVETLVPAIRGLLESVEWSLDDLERIAVDIGPGLFTGMRVGIATAQGLALGIGCPVAPVCSLDAVAHPHHPSEAGIAAVIDARRGEVFSALYDGVGRRVREPRCHPPGDLEVAPGAVVIEGMPDPEAVLALGFFAPELDPAALDALYLRDADATPNFDVLVRR
jgi:tRNA threonylcarbamoyladenosine biosynthesis protein TsaB